MHEWHCFLLCILCAVSVCLATCPDGEFMCTDSQKCISMEQVCDFVIDCEDGSDEVFCGSYSIMSQCMNAPTPYQKSEVCFSLLMTHSRKYMSFDKLDVLWNCKFASIILSYFLGQALVNLRNIHVDGLIAAAMNFNGDLRWQTLVPSPVWTILQDHLGVGIHSQLWHPISFMCKFEPSTVHYL